MSRLPSILAASVFLVCGASPGPCALAADGAAPPGGTERAAAAEKREEGTPATFELRDGSKIMGTLAAGTIAVRSVLGARKISLGIVQGVEMKEDGKTGVVRFPGGDQLVGEVEAEAFELRALVGPISVARNHLLRVAFPAPAAAGAGMAGVPGGGKKDVEKKAPEIGGSVELRDGSRFTGAFGTAVFPLQAPYGKMSIALGDLSTMSVKEDRENVQLVLANGDRLSGVIDLETFEIDSKIGKLSVPFGEIRGVSVDLAFCLYKALSPYLVHGRASRGVRTDFVKDLPEALAKSFERIKRTCDTAGSVDSRSGTAPWLYVPGQGEVPRILVEGDKTLFPIWGTWRQNWSSGQLTADENQQRISGVQPNESCSHHSSELEFYVAKTPVTVKPSPGP
ncbi:MAG: hypothetical protein AAB215_01180 [Planctomycetota bacterium]